MQHALGLPFMIHPLIPEFLTQDAVAEVAKAAEAAGFGIVAVTEHPIPGNRFLDAGGHHAPDPFVTLSFAAGVTSSIRLAHEPHRRAVSQSVPAREGGGDTRPDLQRPLGPRSRDGLPQAGVLRARRRLRRAQRPVRRVARRVPHGVERQRGRLRGAALLGAATTTGLPTPVQDPLPIWIGGNAQRSRQRVADVAQGWMPMPNPRSLGGRRRTAHIDGIDDLRAGIAYMKEHAKKVGRTAPIDIFFPVMVGGTIGSAEIRSRRLSRACRCARGDRDHDGARPDRRADDGRAAQGDRLLCGERDRVGESAQRAVPRTCTSVLHPEGGA